MRAFLICICCCFSAIAYSQDFSSGWLPKINTSTKINKELKWINSIEARATIYDTELNIQHSLIDFTSLASIRTGLNEKLNIGYVIRFKDEKIIHRFMQHYNWISSYNSSKIGHRLGFEQFFQAKEKPNYRTRYRATLQKPLNGNKLDIKEYYFKLSNEYVYAFNDKDLELRLSPYLGYLISKKNKLELGFDYRLSKFLNTNPKHRLWFRTTWYISI